ncbi:MAG: cyclodeaminase/cyclohydrolase family protein [Actinomycetota bacterium]|nr:cyclodeaminase/cyclohydrolase family protein [Actinomycetota bacterium]
MSARAPASPRGESLETSVAEVLGRLAEASPAPGGGAIAAVVGAMAADLVAMVARSSLEHWDGAAGATAQANLLRLRLEPLAHADAEVYQRALAALEEPGTERGRNATLAAALSQAADVPLAIADAAADVAALAEHVASLGDASRRADAVAAAVLAEAAARVCAHLVAVNLATTEGDERLRTADAHVRAAAECSGRALTS